MSQDYETSRQLPTEEQLDAQVTSLQTFAAFDAWMDTQLEMLVTTWAHTAAPAASRIERVWRRFGR